MTEIDDDITTPPTTNPDTGKRVAVEDGAVATAKKTRKRRGSTRIDGKDLTADIIRQSDDAGTGQQYRYWVGVTPSCPVSAIALAGINFPKMNEQLVPNPNGTSQKLRRPVAGALVWLTEDKVRMLRDRLPRTIIRFTDDKGRKDEPGTGENIGDLAQRPRPGHVITAPTEAELRDRRAKGKPAHPYIPDPRRDAPASRFMFAVLCEDQDKPERGEFYPDPLEVTGLEWPDKIAD